MADPRKEALERARLARSRSLDELQGQFTSQWFPGGEAFEQPVIRVHDAAHQWANVNPSVRGELQQQIVDLAGTKAIADQIGARGFVNSFPFGPNAAGAPEFNQENLQEAYRALKGLSHRLVDPVDGVQSQQGLPPNDPARLQLPPLKDSEIKELARRGEEFYSQLGRQWVDSGGTRQAPDAVAGRMSFSPVEGIEAGINVNAAAQGIHERGGGLRISGGYDAPGAMSVGPLEQRMNRPLHYTVDQSDVMTEAANRFRRELAAVPPVSADDDLYTRIDKESARGRLSRRYGLPEYTVPHVLEDGEKARWEADHDRTIRAAGSAGNSKEVSAWGQALNGDPEMADMVAIARDRGKVRQAIATGARGALDMASSVPLADPEFQQAIERQDLGKAAGIVGRDYVIGTAAAPVVGMGAGVLQRMAPAAAARVLPAVAAVGRLSNPVLAVSQLGGDQRQNARVRAAAFKANPAASGGMGPAADPQLLRAEAARRRGGKWGVNTPFGRLSLPELGLSEAGGLFFR